MRGFYRLREFIGCKSRWEGTLGDLCARIWHSLLYTVCNSRLAPQPAASEAAIMPKPPFEEIRLVDYARCQRQRLRIVYT